MRYENAARFPIRERKTREGQAPDARWCAVKPGVSEKVERDSDGRTRSPRLMLLLFHKRWRSGDNPYFSSHLPRLRSETRTVRRFPPALPFQPARSATPGNHWRQEPVHRLRVSLPLPVLRRPEEVERGPLRSRANLRFPDDAQGRTLSNHPIFGRRIELIQELRK